MTAGTDLSGSLALVTGASSGLGRATADALEARGATVVGLDLHEPASSVGDRLSVTVDVSDRRQVQAAVAGARRWGRLPLRVLVCCAGIAPARRLLGRQGLHDTETFRRTVAVNLSGTHHVLAATRQWLADGACVVNTASVAAFEGQVGQVAYAAAKAGVVGLTRRAVRELAPRGIRVNAIAPGTFDTAMAAGASETVLERITSAIPHPSRLGRPEEYAALVLALVDNPAVTGQTVRLDGALRLAPR